MVFSIKVYCCRSAPPPLSCFCFLFYTFIFLSLFISVALVLVWTNSVRVLHPLHILNHIKACPQSLLIIITTGRRGQVRQRGALSGVVMVLLLSPVPIGMHDKWQMTYRKSYPASVFVSLFLFFSWPLAFSSAFYAVHLVYTYWNIFAACSAVYRLVPAGTRWFMLP